MMEHHFRLHLSDETMRGMNRQQYKAASHYIRCICRLVDAGINWEVFYKHISDTMLFGNSLIHIKDLIKN